MPKRPLFEYHCERCQCHSHMTENRAHDKGWRNVVIDGRGETFLACGVCIQKHLDLPKSLQFFRVPGIYDTSKTIEICKIVNDGLEVAGSAIVDNGKLEMEFEMESDVPDEIRDSIERHLLNGALEGMFEFDGWEYCWEIVKND